MNQLSETKPFQFVLRFIVSIAIMPEYMNYWK